MWLKLLNVWLGLTVIWCNYAFVKSVTKISGNHLLNDCVHKARWAQITVVSSVSLCQADIACTVLSLLWRSIRPQLSVGRRHLSWIPAAMQAASGFAVCVRVCSVSVSWSALVLSPFISEPLLLFLILCICLFFLSLHPLYINVICSFAAGPASGAIESWGILKHHHLQDIPLQLSESIQEIKWHSICGRKWFSYQGRCFSSGDSSHLLARWPHLILNLLSGPQFFNIYIITANAQAIKPQ